MPSVTLAAALAGAADTSLFLASRRHLFTERPGRAAGSVVGLAAWSGLALSAALDQRPSRTLALAATVGAMNAGLLAAHLRARVTSPRVFLGAGLAATALLAAAVQARRAATW